jgi:sensor histidine kinase YesM
VTGHGGTFTAHRNEIALPAAPSAGDSTQGRWKTVVHHLMVAARVNALAVVPTTLFLFVIAGERTLQRLAGLVAMVFVLVNANFVILNTFYHHFWEPFASMRRRFAYTVFVILVLPVLGLAGAVLGLCVLYWCGMDMPTRTGSVLAINVAFAVLYGMAFFRLEDSRRSRRDTLLRLEASRRKQEELEGERTQAEIKALQALIQPHFIFNTLNSIVALIHDQPDRAEETTLGLARLMRHILEIRDGSLVTLEAEVGIARSYLEIEQLRMGDRLRYEISLPESMLGFPVPAMLLQPLVENAIKHGVGPLAEGGAIRVSAQRSGDALTLSVADNGRGLTAASGSGVGLANIRARLAALYGERAALRLESNAPRGVVATISIPLAA